MHCASKALSQSMISWPNKLARGFDKIKSLYNSVTVLCGWRLSRQHWWRCLPCMACLAQEGNRWQKSHSTNAALSSMKIFNILAQLDRIGWALLVLTFAMTAGCRALHGCRSKCVFSHSYKSLLTASFQLSPDLKHAVTLFRVFDRISKGSVPLWWKLQGTGSGQELG